MTRVAGSLAKSGEVMKLVNNLMKVPQLHKTMVEMSRGGGACWPRPLLQVQSMDVSFMHTSCFCCSFAALRSQPLLPHHAVLHGACPAVHQCARPAASAAPSVSPVHMSCVMPHRLPLQRWPRRASLRR